MFIVSAIDVAEKKQEGTQEAAGNKAGKIDALEYFYTTNIDGCCLCKFQSKQVFLQSLVCQVQPSGLMVVCN